MGLGTVFAGSGDLLEDLGRLWGALRRLGHILGFLGICQIFFDLLEKFGNIFGEDCERPRLP